MWAGWEAMHRHLALVAGQQWLKLRNSCTWVMSRDLTLFVDDQVGSGDSFQSSLQQRRPQLPCNIGISSTSAWPGLPHARCKSDACRGSSGRQSGRESRPQTSRTSCLKYLGLAPLVVLQKLQAGVGQGWLHVGSYGLMAEAKTPNINWETFPLISTEQLKCHFQAKMLFSSENEIFKREWRLQARNEVFRIGMKFSGELPISSEHENFRIMREKQQAQPENSARSCENEFFQDLGPLGWRRPLFSACSLAFWKEKKQHTLAILRQKKEKGRNKKDDQIGRAFFGRKCTFCGIQDAFMLRWRLDFLFRFRCTFVMLTLFPRTPHDDSRHNDTALSSMGAPLPA